MNTSLQNTDLMKTMQIPYLQDILNLGYEERLYIVLKLHESLINEVTENKTINRKKKKDYGWIDDIPLWQREILEERLERMENGTAKFYSWEEVEKNLDATIERVNKQKLLNV